MAKSKKKLNPLQERFAQEYVIDLNATQAAIRAGYSEKTAGVQACKLLKNVNIQDLIQKAMDKRGQRTEITQDRVLKEIGIIAFAKMGDVATWNPSGVTFKDSSELTADALASIQFVKETTNEFGGSLEIKQYDKLRALELLGKHLKLFTEKVEHSGKVTLEDLIAGSKQNPED